MFGPKLALSIHLIGVFSWVAGIFFCARLLAFLSGRPAGLPADKDLTVMLRRTAIVADVGFTIALLSGLHSLFAYKIYAFAWMHVKLLVVAVLVFLHVFLRREVRRASQGQAPAAFPMLPIVALLVAAVISLAIFKPQF